MLVYGTAKTIISSKKIFQVQRLPGPGGISFGAAQKIIDQFKSIIQDECLGIK